MRVRDEEWLLEKRLLVEKYMRENRTVEKGQILFAGSSLMFNFPIEEMASRIGVKVYNRGIGGFEIDDYMNVIDTVILDLEPSHMFINIGTNDLGDPDLTIDDAMDKYDGLLSFVEERLPEMKITMMAYYPVDPYTEEELMQEELKIRTNDVISEANRKVWKLAEDHGHEFIDVNAGITDENGCLRREYSVDGVHINEEGYEAIFRELKKYIL